jgi:glycosyltransferase involved in cell wall biosynthesis
VRVAFVSEFRNGYEAALEASYARAFSDAGHSVVRIATYPVLATFGNIPHLLTRGWPARLRQAEICAQVEAQQPELVVLIKAVGVLSSSVKRWRSKGSIVVNVFPGNPFEAARTSPGGLTLVEQLRSCNLVFVHDRFAVGQLRQLGIVSDFLAFARDPLLQDRSGPRQEQNASAIAFIGNPDAERIRYLRAVADLGLALWGNWDWAHLAPSDPLAGCIRGGVATGREMALHLGQAKISINVLRNSQKTAHNMRTFESPACGVCTVSERSNAVLELMEDGREVVTFSSPSELREACLRLLADDQTRATIAEYGWQRVKDDTYTRRAEQIVGQLT